MTKLQTIRPMLYTKQITQTIDFYTQKLGFTCLNYNEEWQWATFKRDDIEIMISSPNDHIPFNEPKFTGSFYIITRNVTALWDELKDKATVCYPLEQFEYGMREFALFDNNGYLLQFGEEIE